MSFIAVGTTALGVGGALLASSSSNRAADNAAAAQVEAAQIGTDEIRRQFDTIQENFAPYLGAGENALASQLALTGASGDEAYQQQIDLIRDSPEYSSLIEDGEEAILANASATGGLRGGNVQRSFGQFRPQILSQLIDKRYSQLGGLTSLGQGSAAGQASAGLQTGQAISGLAQQSGAAIAGASIARGNNNANLINGITGSIAGGLSGGF